MTDRYQEWRDFYLERVSSWMSLEELRAECGKLTTTDGTSPDLLLIHAMHALEECEQRDEALLRQALEALEGSRVFVTSREKIKHPEGTEWYDETIAALKERLK